MGNDYLKELYQTVDDTFSYLRKKWTIPIIKGLFCDCKNFKGFLELNPGLSSKVLAERLKELEKNGYRKIESYPMGQIRTYTLWNK